MIPNIISIIRLLGIIPLSISVYTQGIVSVWQCIAYVLIIITDFLDGFIARKYNMVTNFGKILDPIVDKTLVICITLALIFKDIIPTYSLFIYIRDIIVVIVAYYLMFHKYKKVLAANIYGKVKTVLHFIALGLVLLLRKWTVYSLVLLIFSFLTLIPESIFVYKKHIKGA